MAFFERTVESETVFEGRIMRVRRDTVELQNGESAFDLLKQVCRERKIHLEFSRTPGVDSAYIEGIANLYEFGCGSLSGWLYTVNGRFLNYSCSSYEMKAGDVLAFQYTCKNGKDIGAEAVVG